MIAVSEVNARTISNSRTNLRRTIFETTWKARVFASSEFVISLSAVLALALLRDSFHQQSRYEREISAKPVYGKVCGRRFDSGIVLGWTSRCQEIPATCVSPFLFPVTTKS